MFTFIKVILKTQLITSTIKKFYSKVLKYIIGHKLHHSLKALKSKVVVEKVYSLKTVAEKNVHIYQSNIENATDYL